jgi:hypothetical protein
MAALPPGGSAAMGLPARRRPVRQPDGQHPAKGAARGTPDVSGQASKARCQKNLMDEVRSFIVPSVAQLVSQ